MVIYVARGVQQIKVAEFNHHFQFLERKKRCFNRKLMPICGSACLERENLSVERSIDD
jgi:hypothetical protein